MTLRAVGTMPTVESVLIVDDSSVQRTFGADLCRGLGIATVHEASNGLEALALLEALESRPQLLIIDLEMPTMDGPELLSQLRHHGIDIPIMVVSSRERTLIQAVRHMGSVLGLPIVGGAQKPLTSAALGAALLNIEGVTGRKHGKARRLPLDANALRLGLERGEIIVHYHPQVNIRTGELHGVEALARWQHPQLGMVGPDQFIPLAEQHGLIHQLTMQVMSQAMLQAASWQAQELNLSVAINLSPLLFDRADLVQEISGLQQCYNLPADRLVFEVTESSLLHELGVALGVLTRLRLRGFGLSLDDFGTGFSSLQQLAQIPFTELKIDRAFVHGLCDREKLQVMLRSAIEMANELGLVTVAEGVETEEELRLLEEYGCTLAQGWLFAKAMSTADLERWLPAYAARKNELWPKRK